MHGNPAEGTGRTGKAAERTGAGLIREGIDNRGGAGLVVPVAQRATGGKGIGDEGREVERDPVVGLEGSEVKADAYRLDGAAIGIGERTGRNAEPKGDRQGERSRDAGPRSTIGVPRDPGGIDRDDLEGGTGSAGIVVSDFGGCMPERTLVRESRREGTEGVGKRGEEERSRMRREVGIGARGTPNGGRGGGTALGTRVGRGEGGMEQGGLVVDASAHVVAFVENTAMRAGAREGGAKHRAGSEGVGMGEEGMAELGNMDDERSTTDQPGAGLDIPPGKPGMGHALLSCVTTGGEDGKLGEALVQVEAKDRA